MAVGRVACVETPECPDGVVLAEQLLLRGADEEDRQWIVDSVRDRLWRRKGLESRVVGWHRAPFGP